MRDWSQNSYNQQQYINTNKNILQESIETQKYDEENIISLINCEKLVSVQLTTILDTDQKQPKQFKKKQQKLVQAQRSPLCQKYNEEQSIEEEIQQNKQSTKNDLQHLSKQFLHSQEIIVNQGFKNNIQIYLRKLLIQDNNIRKIFLNHIIGDIDQIESLGSEQKVQNNLNNIIGDIDKIQSLEFEQEEQNICLPLPIDNDKRSDTNQTVQKLYLRKNKDYSVSVKAYFSKDKQKLIVQKILTLAFEQDPQQFRDSALKEINILKQIQSKIKQVTLPYINHDFFKDKFGYEQCILSITSGIKNLEQVRKYYQNNKKYEEYNTILEFAFCQLLSKLNQMHRICQIAHSDIKPQNIVVGYDLQFYFIDFGASIYLEDKEQFQYYLESFSENYNLDIFIEKRKKKEWKYLEIIDCDTSQLILTFLKMFDVEDNYYKELRDFRIQNKNECKQLLMPEFKRLGQDLEYPKQKLFLFSNFGDYFRVTMKNLYDIIYNEAEQQYVIKSINMLSIQILELIIQNDQSCKFLINEITHIDEYIHKINQQQDGDISKYPNFCKYFQLKQTNIIFFGYTDYNFNNKGIFIKKLLCEFFQFTSHMMPIQPDVPIFLIENMEVSTIHVYFKYQSKYLIEQFMGFNLKTLFNQNGTQSSNLLQICFENAKEINISAIFEALLQKINNNNSIKIILSINQIKNNITSQFLDQVENLSNLCSQKKTK
ncbi:hypothetical protein ABPG72_003345 [Tetrahymena utriculariae]